MQNLPNSLNVDELYKLMEDLVIAISNNDAPEELEKEILDLFLPYMFLDNL